jgi:hypothetical protein
VSWGTWPGVAVGRYRPAVHRRRPSTSRPPLLGVALLIVAAATACGDDDETAPPTTSAAVPASATPAPQRTSPPSGAPALDVADACALVPTADVVAATDLAVDDGVPAGDERRRVCTFQAVDGTVGITVGVEGTDRFEEKAAASRRSLGVDGEPIDGLGDAALFFFSDEDLPEGVGGTLVAVGTTTVDVTLQGLDEPALRDASVAIAELAVANL